MLYEQNLKKHLDEYQKLNQQYQNLIQSEKFRQISSTMPFDLLKCRYIVETLALYKDMNGQSRIHFSSGEEAVQRFFDIVNFKKVAEDVLESAAFVSELSELEEAINQLVTNSPYLSNAMEVPSLGRLTTIANDVLKETPRYRELMTKEFRIGYIESCIDCLPKEELSKLLVARIIKGSDLDKIKLNGSEQYMENIQYLCEITGHTKIIEKTYQLNLAGVTFKDETHNISRQEYLKELKQCLRDGKTPNIQAESYMYRPDIGLEEPSIRILWDGKCIGHIQRAIAKELTETYENPNYEAIVQEITGGGVNCNYGCKITLNVISSKRKEVEETLEK